MNGSDHRIPGSTLRWMGKVPQNRAVAVLLRHSVRDDLLPVDAGGSTPITEKGEELARELGGVMGGKLRSLRCSPVLRCVQTAECIRDGSSAGFPIVNDRMLGDPGAFVADGERAWSVWEALGHEEVMHFLMCQDDPMPGMENPNLAAWTLLEHMLSAINDEPGLHLFVSHDSLIIPTVARILGEVLEKDDWPCYLEGAFFWRQGGEIWAAYKDWCRCCSLPHAES